MTRFELLYAFHKTVLFLFELLNIEVELVSADIGLNVLILSVTVRVSRRDALVGFTLAHVSLVNRLLGYFESDILEESLAFTV